jgi:leucyl aminopeptidase
MMKLCRFLTSALLFSVLLKSTAIAQPFFLTHHDAAKFRPDAAGIVYQQAGTKVWRSLDARTSEFDKLYTVNFQKTQKSKDELSTYGEVLHLVDKQFAIMKLESLDQVARLSSELHHAGMACGAVIRLDGDAIIAPSTTAPGPISSLDTKLSTVESMISKVEAGRIESTINQMESIHTRYARSQTGATIADRLIELYRPLADGRSDVRIETFDHSAISIRQPSLVVRVIGRSKPDEIVILGSHIDSIVGFGSGSARSPGADDNASGTATNLEIFRVMMQHGIGLERTLEIHGYAAEELGLLGSKEIAKKYKQTNKNVIAMVQHDMNLYSQDGIDKIWFVSNETSNPFNQQLISLLRLYLNVPYDSAPLYAGSSDHYSWSQSGFHAAFPFEDPNNYNPNIHTADDTSSNADSFGQAAEFAKLGLAYIAHFAGIAVL